MKIYNTLSRRKEEFQPLEEGKVKMYVIQYVDMLAQNVKPSDLQEMPGMIFQNL